MHYGNVQKRNHYDIRRYYTLKIYHYEGKANIIGPQIKLARINQNLTQEELAIKMQLRNIEISQKVISRIEKQERFVADYE